MLYRQPCTSTYSEPLQDSSSQSPSHTLYWHWINQSIFCPLKTEQQTRGNISNFKALANRYDHAKVQTSGFLLLRLTLYHRGALVEKEFICRVVLLNSLLYLEYLSLSLISKCCETFIF